MTKNKMMADFRMRLLPLFRRQSASSGKSNDSPPATPRDESGIRSGIDLSLHRSHGQGSTIFTEPVYEKEAELPMTVSQTKSQSQVAASKPLLNPSLDISKSTLLDDLGNPKVTLEEPTPEPLQHSRIDREEGEGASEGKKNTSTEPVKRPEASLHKQSLAHSGEKRLIKTLLEPDRLQVRGQDQDHFDGPSTLCGKMLHRKIWVKRAGGSATLVQIHEDDLVDDVRDMILKKYANSLGRSFDSPDVILRIVPRDHSHRHSQGERTLGPEESIAKTLDAYYPGGQQVEEALIIDVPTRRTPRQSPRVHLPYHTTEDSRPVETDREYFPPMPAGAPIPSPHLSSNASASGSHHSMSILNTGQAPLLPSPGSRGVRHSHRPRMGRNTTSSPTVLATPSIHNGM